MTPHDLFALLVESLRAYRLRTFLTVLGIVIGIASVILVGAVSEGARAGIADQFSEFGTTVVAVTPGRQQTFGLGPGSMGGTTRPLTIGDARALGRIPGVRSVAPHALGLGEVESDTRRRRIYIYGTVAEDEDILNWSPQVGSFLPKGDPDRIPAVCVLGPRTARELFPDGGALGARIRVAEGRFTVVGIMGPKGQMLGFDLDDMVYIPVHRAMKLFNRRDLMEIVFRVDNPTRLDGTIASVRRELVRRHREEEDFTILRQDDMLDTIGEIMNVLTIGVVVIASISLLVGALGILTVMWISVHERRWEVGLMRALGASRAQVLLVFLGEAGMLSVAGGLLGLGLAWGAVAGIGWWVPGIWIRIPAWSLPTTLGVSLLVGLLAGILPALRAARLDPVEALRAE